MSKFHSTVSRRDFMKALGLGAAGLGAASAATPVFHDLDEVIASPSSIKPKHPWWVKERPYLDPTTEIDWDIMERFDAAIGDNTPSHLTQEHFLEVMQMGKDTRKRDMLESPPGRGLRDYALGKSLGHGWVRSIQTAKEYFLGSSDVMGPDKLGGGIEGGCPRWEGTPEENARMMRKVVQCEGGIEVSFGELIEGKTKKLINLSTKDQGPKMRIVFEDVDRAYVEEPTKRVGKMVIPNKYTSVMVITIRQPLEPLLYSPSYLQTTGSHKAYQQIYTVQWRIKKFLNNIGYEGIGGGTYGITCGRPGWGTIYGLGELGRHHELITPEFGPIIRTTMILITDLPLPVCNPIEFGASRFCDTCHKCVDVCPVGAIYNGERDYIRTPVDATGGPIPPDNLKPELFNNSPGYKRWPLNHYACGTLWVTNAGSCSNCQASCVFSKPNKASIHELIKPVVGGTSLLNGFFYNMDEAFGYGLVGEHKAPGDWEAWATRDMPDFWAQPFTPEDMNY